MSEIAILTYILNVFYSASIMLWVCSRPPELGISMRAEGSKNISPWVASLVNDQ